MATTGWFEGFEERRLPVGEVQLRVRLGGRVDAPTLLLLHGFPQTGAMWHRVA
jgi:haloacetate dehalogenase